MTMVSGRHQSNPSRHALPPAVFAVPRAARATAREVQKDAVVLRLRVQGLQDVVRCDQVQAGGGARARAGVSGQSSGGGGGVGRQRALGILSRGRLWQDAGGVMTLRLQGAGPRWAADVGGLRRPTGVCRTSMLQRYQNQKYFII